MGTDIVSVEAVRDALQDHGERYLKRIYTPTEVSDCTVERGLVPERLAARFAAKEATLKVLRPAEEAIPWKTMEIVRDPSGWVSLSLTGEAASAASDRGLHGFAVSISHETVFATAVVVAEQTLSD